MKFIIKLHPEINIKSRSVRKRFTRLLESNIRLIFKHNEMDVAIKNQYDHIDLRLKGDAVDRSGQAEDILRNIPGVDQYLQVSESDFTDMDDIYRQVREVYEPIIKDKTFAVRVKRKGNHEFKSVDVARHVGGCLNQLCASKGVNLTTPDITINLQINRDKLLIVQKRVRALGGMPLPTQDDVLSLISGGYDSGVASYLTMRRGAKTHFCFFNLGGKEHEIGVQEVSYFLWKKFSSSHKVKFIAVDFAPIVADILENVENSLMGVVLKRHMLRAAEIVASNLQIESLVTGEAMGQVSSQTLHNLHVIDQATQKLVLRPLICSDKADIINIAREIGTEDFAASMPEYCGVISVKPNVKAPMDKVLEQEAKCDLELIAKVVADANVKDIKKLGEQTDQQISAVQSSSAITKDAVLLDIRSIDEQEARPLQIEHEHIEHLPFFKLASQFPTMDQSKEYFLYCDRGVMSKMQALLLQEQGYKNVKVYRP